MIRIMLSTRLGERRMTQSELARATGIRSQTINEMYHDFSDRSIWMTSTLSVKPWTAHSATYLFMSRMRCAE